MEFNRYFYFYQSLVIHNYLYLYLSTECEHFCHFCPFHSLTRFLQVGLPQCPPPGENKKGGGVENGLQLSPGSLAYLVIPFKSTNAVFQALIYDVLCDMLNRCVCLLRWYSDLFSRTLQEHVEHVRLLLQLLENRYHGKAKRCEFQGPQTNSSTPCGQRPSWL